MTTATPLPTRSPYPLARPMFWLAFVYLLIVAGFIHRGSSSQVTPLEMQVMTYGLLGLWPIIFVETWIAVFIRDRALRPRFSTVIRAIWITLIPPLRMGMPCPFTGWLWVPFMGWCERGKLLEDRLERGFHKPMLVFALLVLPVLAFEFVQAEEVRANPALALALDIGLAVIWIAFALEFVIKVSAIRRPFVYSRQRWLDLAIVVLPMLEFALKSFAEAAPLARLLRMSRAMAPEQIARMGQMYRLRGLVMKGWRAFLVLRIVAKLTGNTPEKQLRRLETEIGDMETMLAEMRTQADALRKRVDADAAEEAAAAPDNQPSLP